MTSHAFKSAPGLADAQSRNQWAGKPSKRTMTMRTRQRHAPRRGERRSHRDPRAARAMPDQEAVRIASGVQDHALYACTCGHAFSAGVSTSVDCPRCGAGQAW